MAELEYAYAGAKALVRLHAREMRAFLASWRKARAADLPLPACEDPSYRSLEHLLCHVLGGAQEDIVYICRKCGLSDPAVDPPPSPQQVDERADDYLRHLLARWDGPLAGLTADQASAIEAILEHAVMHPIRHRYQLENWLADRNG